MFIVKINNIGDKTGTRRFGNQVDMDMIGERGLITEEEIVSSKCLG